LTGDKRLGSQASLIFKAAERGETQIVISAIVIAEMYYANKKTPLFADFQLTYRTIKAKPQYQLEPFISDHVSDFDQDMAVPEMHDRIIAGLAKRLGTPLLTADPVIIKANIAMVVW